LIKSSFWGVPMNKYLRISIFLLIYLIVSFGLSGCQILELLWPSSGLGEIADSLPDDADLKDLEEAIDEMEDALEDEVQDPAQVVTISPITNAFTLHYKYESEAMGFNGRAEETFRVIYQSDTSKGSPSRMIFPFTKTFDGYQYATVTGSNACYVNLKSDVDYLVMGEFLPETCEFKFIFEADLEDMNVVENTCIDLANALENFPTFFSLPPETTIVITKENEVVFLNPYHSVWISDVEFGYT
jgi:hypothetical protein